MLLGGQRTLPGMQAEIRKLWCLLQPCFLSEWDPYAPALGSVGDGMGLGHPFAHPVKLGSRTGVTRQCVPIQML